MIILALAVGAAVGSFFTWLSISIRLVDGALSQNWEDS
jgi:hypothetical protein